MVGARPQHVPLWDHRSAAHIIGAKLGLPYKPTLLIVTPPPDTMRDELPPLPLTMTSQPYSASISLKAIADWDGSSQAIYGVLATVFEAPDYLDCIKYLSKRGIDPESYINNLDKVRLFSILRQHSWCSTILTQIIDALPVDSELRRPCLRALKKTCGLYGILPTSYTITHLLSRPGPRAFAWGVYCDVWRLSDEQNPKKIFAVKVLRVYEQDPFDKINKVRSFLQIDLIARMKYNPFT